MTANLFLTVLEKLIAWDGQHFGGDVENDLIDVVYDGCAERGVDEEVHGPLALGYIRALYALGLITACAPPADGEVGVHADRVRALLALVTGWRPPEAPPSPEDMARRQAALNKLHGLPPIQESILATATPPQSESFTEEALEEILRLREEHGVIARLVDQLLRDNEEELAVAHKLDISEVRGWAQAPGRLARAVTKLRTDLSEAHAECDRLKNALAAKELAKKLTAEALEAAKATAEAERKRASLKQSELEAVEGHRIDAEKRVASLERRLTSPVGADPLHGHAAWCYRVEYHETARCCCGVEDAEDDGDA